MATIGSVFLGDIQHRLRLLSPTTSSPPSSPPNNAPPTPINNVFSAVQPSSSSMSKPDGVKAPPLIEPALSLELRLRWLEAILLGVRQEIKTHRGKEKCHELKNGETLSKVADDIQRRLNIVVEENDGLRRFMENCKYFGISTFARFSLTKRWCSTR